MSMHDKPTISLNPSQPRTSVDDICNKNPLNIKGEVYLVDLVLVSSQCLHEI
jgi:hypothetical protein